ncbi:hypothetical protein ACLB1O_28810 [Escherichia coli]
MEAFTEKDQFFHGVGVDGVYLPFHKANQFLVCKIRCRHLSLMT